MNRYKHKAEHAAIEEAREELSRNEDYITVLDVDGNQRDFIIQRCIVECDE